MQPTDSAPDPATTTENSPHRRACLRCDGALYPSRQKLDGARSGAPGSYRLMRCQRCGLAQIEPRLSSAELLALQEASFTQRGGADSYGRLIAAVLTSPLYRLWLAVDGDWSGHALALNRPDGATAATATATAKKRLLDVGCGQGRSAKLFRAAGFEVTGVEPSARQARQARLAELTVVEARLETDRMGGRFDAILLANALEHLDNPRAALRRCAGLLAPGGWLFVSCPNRLSWQRRLFGRAWINWYAPFHLCHFAPQDLQALLAEAGLTITRARQVSPSLWTAQSLVCALTGNGATSARWLRQPLLMSVLTLLAAGLGWPLRALSNLCGGGDCLVYLVRAAAPPPSPTRNGGKSGGAAFLADKSNAAGAGVIER